MRRAWDKPKVATPAKPPVKAVRIAAPEPTITLTADQMRAVAAGRALVLSAEQRAAWQKAVQS